MPQVGGDEAAAPQVAADEAAEPPVAADEAAVSTVAADEAAAYPGIPGLVRKLEDPPMRSAGSWHSKTGSSQGGCAHSRDPAPFREPTESAPEPTPFREPTEPPPGAHRARSVPGAHRARSILGPNPLLDICQFLCVEHLGSAPKGGLCHGPAGVP